MLQISKECEQAILALAPKHHACADAPSNIKELREWYKSNTLNVDSLPVYDGGSDDTIFGSREVNFAFRAWHDALHLENNLGFSQEDELTMAMLHCKELRLMGISEDDCDLMFNDVAGQVLYYYNSKEFINNQQHFHVALSKDCNIMNYKQQTVGK